MATSKRCNVSSENLTVNDVKTPKIDINSKVDLIIQSKKHANDVFDVLEYLQSEKEKNVVCAINGCTKLFSTLLERGDLYVGQLPKEELLIGGFSKMLSVFGLTMLFIPMQESALCALMQFASMEGKFPLQDLDWSEHYSFPRELIQAVVERLLSQEEDMAVLISRFQEYLDMVDVRYYVMSSVRENVGRVMDKTKGAVMPIYQNNVFTLLSNINMPSQESELTNYLEHKRAFERLWLGFLKYKLPSSMYKKVLVILHDSILPHISNPTVMIDFLTAAYDVGGAISLLALNGLFVLIHQHNLDYPDFYKKLYSLLEPSVFHVKYRARFFHLANLFLSSTHLPVYLVAAFAKRLSRLALTAPPAALLMVLPFICNLIRRHPACRVLIHQPKACDDPYLMEEEDPSQCHALESSLWELQTLQKHYHPDVAKAAMAINKPLSQQEDDISELLELSTYELMERDLKHKQSKTVPLEFDPATQLLQGSVGVLGLNFSLE
uniref:Nucleolar complex associated 4 homolog n=1 Tax=Salmo trutta TaxID=8032 RepID=A0A674C6X2_SALTR